MQKTAKKKCVHLKVSARLYRSLKEDGRREGRSPSAQAEYDLELILPIIQGEGRYRIAPDLDDFGSPTHELKPCPSLEAYEVLCEQARSSGLSTSEQSRQYLWFVAERRCELYPKGGILLVKEEFQKRIREYLRGRFAKIQ